MSVTAVPLHPLSKGTVLKVWLGIALIIALGVGLAWLGTSAQQVSTTASGLRYRVIEQGEGEIITPNDLVALEFTLLRRDGSVLLSTRQQGRPVQASADNGLPPALREVLLMMRQGTAMHVWLPARAFNEAPPPPESGITADELLELRIKAVQVMPGMAAMQQMMEQQGAGGPPPGMPAGPGQMPPGAEMGPTGGPVTGPAGPPMDGPAPSGPQAQPTPPPGQ